MARQAQSTEAARRRGRGPAHHTPTAVDRSEDVGGPRYDYDGPYRRDGHEQAGLAASRSQIEGDAPISTAHTRVTPDVCAMQFRISRSPSPSPLAGAGTGASVTPSTSLNPKMAVLRKGGTAPTPAPLPSSSGNVKTKTPASVPSSGHGPVGVQTKSLWALATTGRDGSSPDSLADASLNKVHLKVPPSLHGKPAKRTRTSKPKVRTGCICCKRRHVKCDERKPTCLKCENFGIPCEGYAPPKQPKETSKSSHRVERQLLPRPKLQPAPAPIRAAPAPAPATAKTPAPLALHNPAMLAPMQELTPHDRSASTGSSSATAPVSASVPSPSPVPTPLSTPGLPGLMHSVSVAAPESVLTSEFEITADRGLDIQDLVDPSLGGVEEVPLVLVTPPPLAFPWEDEDNVYWSMFAHQMMTGPSHFDCGSWARILMREAMSTDCIRHSILSIGAFCKATTESRDEEEANFLFATTAGASSSPLPSASGRSKLWIDTRRNRHHHAALAHHMKALGHLRQVMHASDPDGRLTMMATLLFIIFENMQGNYAAAGSMIRSGIKVLASATLDTYIDKQLLRHSLSSPAPSSIASSASSPRSTPSPTPSYPSSHAAPTHPAQPAHLAHPTHLEAQEYIPLTILRSQAGTPLPTNTAGGILVADASSRNTAPALDPIEATNIDIQVDSVVGMPGVVVAPGNEASQEIAEMTQMFARQSISCAHIPFPHCKSAYHMLLDPRFSSPMANPHLPAFPTTLEQARSAWDFYFPRLGCFFQKATWHNLNQGYDFDAPSAKYEQEEHLLWLGKFGALLESLDLVEMQREREHETRPSRVKKGTGREGIELLMIQHMVATIFISCCMDRSEMMYDAFAPQFAALVARCGAFIGRRASKVVTGPVIILGFAMEVELLPLIGFIISKCRVRSIRDDAYALLGRCQWREGCWDGKSLLNGMTGLLGLERMGMDATGHVPTRCRWVWTNAVWNLDDRSLSLEYTKALPNESGEYEKNNFTMAL